MFDEGLELEVDEYLYPSGIKLLAECFVAGQLSRAFQWDGLVGIAVERVIAGGQDGVCCFLWLWGAVLYIPR